MRTILLLLFICTAPVVYAQRDCATSNYIDQEKVANPALAKTLTAIESFVQKHKSVAVGTNLRTSSNQIIKIPVVVHVVYNTTSENISDEQIKSQLDVLNKDYRRRNLDAVNTPDRFKTVAADAKIEFYLATADPKGRATTGIIRKKTSAYGWMMNDKIKFSAQGGDDAWDSKSYLNIWVGNLRSALGYATAPGGDPAKDGLVISYTAFGTINTAAPYNLGRTATHEIGHWLGLKHIWGDTYCGDDLVTDTPPQGGFTPGCPSGFRSTCTNGAIGDMYMNYMDFTYDACINLFTEGQKDRMRTMFEAGGPRASLLSSKGLSEPWMYESPLPVPVVGQAGLYPNPAKANITITLDDQSWVGQKIQIVNTNGVLVKEIAVTSTSLKVDVTSLQSGVYFVKGVNVGRKFIEKLMKL
jgi:hypothetical protein